MAHKTLQSVSLTSDELEALISAARIAEDITHEPALLTALMALRDGAFVLTQRILAGEEDEAEKAEEQRLAELNRRRRAANAMVAQMRERRREREAARR